jgi:hypothetical protein
MALRRDAAAFFWFATRGANRDNGIPRDCDDDGR